MTTEERRIDYRVRLDFTYIPKNAYEIEAFFKIMLKCKKQRSVPEFNDELKQQKFWETHKVTGGSQNEVLRDMLDFAAYIGILRKDYLLAIRGKAIYKLTKIGENMCKKFLKRDLSVKSDLINALMNYKIPNDQLNLKDYFQFNQFQVRPFFILLKILYLFQKKWPNASLNVKPKELGFLVLSITKEDENQIHDAINNLFELNDDSVSVVSLLQKINYNMKEFDRKTNNQITRLFRWAYYLDLIECETSDDSIIDFFKKWSLTGPKRWRGIKIKQIYGLTKTGKSVYKRLENTFYLWERNLDQNEIIILEVLKKVGAPVNKDVLFKLLENEKLCKQQRYETHLRRLVPICLTQEKGDLKLHKTPIFCKIQYNTQDIINRILKQIKPNIKTQTIEKPKFVDFSFKFVEDMFNYLIINKIIEDKKLNKLENKGLERDLLDYWELSLGEEKLKLFYRDKKIKDIRQVFEKKTASIFKRLGYLVKLFGQKKRGHVV